MTHSNDQRDDRGLRSEESIGLWLDLEADGGLAPEEAAQLDAALGLSPEMRSSMERERLELARVHEMLAEARVGVRPGFRDEVMQALPQAAWEPVRGQGWGVAMGIAAAVALLSAVLLTLSGASLAGSGLGGSGLGLLVAIGELLQASVVTGAGLLGASWRGLGLALQQSLGSSPATLAAFGFGVLALNVLFLRLLRRGGRRSPLALERAAADDDRPRR